MACCGQRPRYVRPRFFDGFQRCISTLASAGNDLVVDHIIECPAWRAELKALLQAFDVFLVRVHCSPEELDRREQVRGDRWIGEGRSHVVEDLRHRLDERGALSRSTRLVPAYRFGEFERRGLADLEGLHRPRRSPSMRRFTSAHEPE